MPKPSSGGRSSATVSFPSCSRLNPEAPSNPFKGLTSSRLCASLRAGLWPTDLSDFSGRRLVSISTLSSEGDPVCHPAVGVESSGLFPQACRARAGAPAPGSCNTGAKTSTQGALRSTGTRTSGHERGDYFDSLRVDTLKLSADVATDSVRQLGLDWVNLKDAAGPDSSPTVAAHDGTELEVQPHSPNDNRAVLMLGEGVEVTAVRTCQVPFLSVEFGASWCWNHDPEELAQWARGFCSCYGIEIERTLVSRLDLCVDVDERFYRSDVDRFEGQHRGNLEGTVSFSDGAHGFTGLRYQRTEDRDLTFRVYDKRAEVDTRDGHTFWNEVWDAHSVSDDSPIWRVEFEAQRGRLKERGIDSWDDLDGESLESFWTYAAEGFACMDRQLWTRIQDASTQAAAVRASVEPAFDPSGLLRQAAGCVESAAEGCETSPIDEFERLLDRELEEEEKRRLSRRLSDDESGS